MRHPLGCSVLLRLPAPWGLSLRGDTPEHSVSRLCMKQSSELGSASHWIPLSPWENRHREPGSNSKCLGASCSQRSAEQGCSTPTLPCKGMLGWGGPRWILPSLPEHPWVLILQGDAGSSPGFSGRLLPQPSPKNLEEMNHLPAKLPAQLCCKDSK